LTTLFVTILPAFVSMASHATSVPIWTEKPYLCTQQGTRYCRQDPPQVSNNAALRLRSLLGHLEPFSWLAVAQRWPQPACSGSLTRSSGGVHDQAHSQSCTDA